MSTLTINRSTIILAMKNIESIIKNVLTNLLFTNEEIETVIKNNKILNGLKEDNDIYIDFIITVPYHDKKNLFDLGELLNSAEQRKVEIAFNNKAELKEVKIIYRDDNNKSTLIIILDNSLKYYDFVIKMDDINAIVKHHATLKIKENINKLSAIFPSHKSILLSMLDDILYENNDYFNIQSSGVNLVVLGKVNHLLLKTTAIYTGVVNQHVPLKIRSTNAMHLPYSEVCEISFDNNQNIRDVKFKIFKNDGSTIDIMVLSLNSDFEIIELMLKERPVLINSSMVIRNKEFNYKYLPLADVITLLKLKYNVNENILELFPELLIPSAYNFNSDEFKDRLEVANMMLD